MSELESAKALSVQLQRIAGELSANLDHAAGAPVAFVLLVSTGNMMQSVQNVFVGAIRPMRGILRVELYFWTLLWQ